MMVTLLHLASILVTYSLACLGSGLAAMKVLCARNLDEPYAASGATLASAYLLGQGILANLWLLITLQGWFSPVLVKTGVPFLAACGITLGYKILGSFTSKLIHTYTEAVNYSPGWRLIVLLTTMSFLAWGTSLGRAPVGDGTAFYLAIAKVISDSHRLVPLPGYEEFTSIGLQGEMHYAAIMSLGSPGAALLFPWPTFLAGALLLAAIAQLVGINRKGQWLALAMIFTSSFVIESIGSGKIDLFAAALGFAAYYWAVRIRDTPGQLAFWLAGLFGGLAIVAKVSYILTFAPSLAILVAWNFISRPSDTTITHGRKRLLPFVIVCSGMLLMALPHLLKNTMLFDNPLAPFEPGKSGFQDQTWYGTVTTRQILFTLPFALTFGDYWAQLGNLSPLVVAFLPLLVIIPRPHQYSESQLWRLTVSALVGLAFWFILRPSVLAPRYFMACLLLLVLPAAHAAEFIFKQPRLQILGTVIVLATVVVTTTSGLYHLDRVFFPRETISYLSSDCETDHDSCGLELINRSLDPGKRLFTTTFLRYWLRSDLIQCALTGEEADAYLALETPQQRWTFIHARGFDFIPLFGTWNTEGVLDSSKLEPTPKWTLLEATVRRDLEDVPNWLSITRVDEMDIVLLEITSNDPSRRPLIGCSQIQPPSWELINLIDS